MKVKWNEQCKDFREKETERKVFTPQLDRVGPEIIVKISNGSTTHSFDLIKEVRAYERKEDDEMSTEARMTVLRTTYPALIFLAVLGIAGMRLVQAGGTDVSFRFPDQRGPTVPLIPASAKTRSCTILDQSDSGAKENSTSCVDEGDRNRSLLSDDMAQMAVRQPARSGGYFN